MEYPYSNDTEGEEESEEKSEDYYLSDWSTEENEQPTADKSEQLNAGLAAKRVTILRGGKEFVFESLTSLIQVIAQSSQDAYNELWKALVEANEGLHWNLNNGKSDGNFKWTRYEVFYDNITLDVEEPPLGQSLDDDKVTAALLIITAISQ